MTGNELETFLLRLPQCYGAGSLVRQGEGDHEVQQAMVPELWRVDDPAGVWRVEFQLRRAFLLLYRINTINDLCRK